MIAMMMTVITIPAIDTPSDARPSFLAPFGSVSGELFANTAHMFEYILHQSSYDDVVPYTTLPPTKSITHDTRFRNRRHKSTPFSRHRFLVVCHACHDIYCYEGRSYCVQRTV